VKVYLQVTSQHNMQFF